MKSAVSASPALTISAASRPNGGSPACAPRRRLGFEKPVAVARGECLHDRLVRHTGLDQHPALVLGAAGAAADLMQQLIGPLGGAQIAAGEPEIGIDDADQGQHRKMVALGDDLGPDQQIVAPLGHRLGELGRGARAGQQIADHQRRPRCRKALRHLLEQALDPRPARHQGAGRQAFRAAGRHRLGVAAMMAQEAAGKAMLDQPGGAVRALKAMAAGAAQGQGRVAAAIEEQQRLLAGVKGRGEFAPPAAATESARARCARGADR